MLYHGDMRVVLADWPAQSVAACVTDPPYELGFMGKAWDRSGVAFQAETWAAVRRVLKPGAHLLAFGGTRTFHRLACAIEDAGFELRDTLCWLYGSGFPKSLDVSKALDKAAGAERAVVGVGNRHGGGTSDKYAQDAWTRAHMADVPPITAPATDLAQQWDGWGTALKPGWEPIILARAPLSEPTVAANVARWGTGALNVDGCRIGWLGGHPPSIGTPGWGGPQKKLSTVPDQHGATVERMPPHTAGRWPPNVALSHTLWCNGECAPDCPVALLDGQSGPTPTGGRFVRNGHGGGAFGAHGIYGQAQGKPDGATWERDTGGASRFFYCSKASTRERSAGLPASTRNEHATVKPVALCRWLTRLVTPPGGLICDPFMGSGSIGVAAREEGMDYWGVEQHAPYLETARQRIGMGA